MTELERLRPLLVKADEMKMHSSKEELFEAAGLLAINLAHYQAKYGELPLDETLAVAYSDNPNQDQLELTADGMEILIGVLGGILQGFEEKLTH